MKSGTKLVCIKSFRGVNKLGQKLPYRAPKEGELFTSDGYGGYDEMFSCHYVYLLEIPVGSAMMFGRPRFNQSHFRPVDDIHAEWTESLVKELEEEMEEYVSIEAL